MPDIDFFETNIETLKQKRLKEISEKIIPKSNRLPNWEEALTEILVTNTSYNNGNWRVPGLMINDRHNYWILNKSNGFEASPYSGFNWASIISLSFLPNLKIIIFPSDSGEFLS